ncbi:hypothetical protein SLEP1_g50889 [Rubroshorea leprosula]|uniref:Peptidase S9A N-terminal domain-containing protein n=1 Tax=Rubroshorea leprosula TaxID=152421 RepID=A0AAV5M1I8_9ROSI|nr:hypothetical protein SLEP1_g50889 [Rubroshorea leprosula]
MGSLSALDQPLQYPIARRDESVVNDYHGVKISDPYRWLEDPDSAETKEFVQKQVELCESVLKKCNTREQIRERVTKLFDHPRYGAPYKRGNNRYPAPKEGENIDAGTETNTNLYHELYYHFLGTDQSEDILCWRDSENPKFIFRGSVTDDGKYLLLYISENCDPVNKVYYCNMSALSEGLQGFRGKDFLLPFVKLVDQFDALYTAIANDDTLFTFRTNKGAPRYKLVHVDLKEPSNWIDVIPESEKDVLKSANAVNGNKMIVNYLSDVKYVLQIRDLETGSFLHQLPLDIGTVYEITARREDDMFFIYFSSFLTPGIIYQCNLGAGVPDMKIFREISVPGFDRTEFDVNQVYYCCFFQSLVTSGF